MDQVEADRDRLREAVIVALAELKRGRAGAARSVLEGALDGTGLDDGRESARIIARQYRAEQAWKRAQDDQRGT